VFVSQVRAKFPRTKTPSDRVAAGRFRRRNTLPQLLLSAVALLRRDQLAFAARAAAAQRARGGRGPSTGGLGGGGVVLGRRRGADVHRRLVA